ncbi:hypothetical protein Paes_2315 [Prosthecochloris aestuarii DSM 271]|uniref:TIR domain-containing protein n=1 Tax=Prosthecochloris aestuarii (strain DSM 271 / SK 413) TaxID=290512 RepID=B4S6V6_PROA2|nr:hypothetical protein [Prosthecochloris aestuarii]ACF47311.1 hypothetical protein Paes_2315 [Prosthecochloris aestuarii DSM 271]
MAHKIISIAEVLLVIASLAIAIIWIKNPQGDYEPVLVFIGIVLVALDIIRRFLRSLQLKVFLSVGATYTQQQEIYVKAFERFLKDNNCRRLVVGRDCPSSRQPVLQVRDLMRKADAVIVLAFTRYVISSGVQKPGANHGNHKEVNIQNEKHPTVWNQIEASMAFGLRRPLLVIIENGLKQEAMLKDRLEFRAINTDLDAEYFESEEFRAVFSDFSKIVRRRSWLKL